MRAQPPTLSQDCGNPSAYTKPVHSSLDNCTLIVRAPRRLTAGQRSQHFGWTLLRSLEYLSSVSSRFLRFRQFDGTGRKKAVFRSPSRLFAESEKHEVRMTKEARSTKS